MLVRASLANNAVNLHGWLLLACCVTTSLLPGWLLHRQVSTDCDQSESALAPWTSGHHMEAIPHAVTPPYPPTEQVHRAGIWRLRPRTYGLSWWSAWNSSSDCLQLIFCKPCLDNNNNNNNNIFSVLKIYVGHLGQGRDPHDAQHRNAAEQMQASYTSSQWMSYCSWGHKCITVGTF
jgi:hypothetical protein